MAIPQKRRSALLAGATSVPGVLKRQNLECSTPSPARLPGGIELQKLLALKFGDPVENLLKPALLSPISDLTGRPGKQIRGRLVGLGYRLACPASPVTGASERRCQAGAQIVEFIHAGSLIVDDIEDGSTMRRGSPTLHCQYGLPLALNAGNWLYFWPLQVLKEMGLSESQELLVYRHYHQTLLRAHFGQALDLGVRIDSIEQHRVQGIVLSSMELKTGALVAFALVLGGILAGASEKMIQMLDEFGHGFGVGLQMFDDLGNLVGRVEPAKKFEDLVMRRPSWVWACAARGNSERDYGEFISAVRLLPEAGSLENWLLARDLFNRGKRQALVHFTRVFAKLRLALGRGCDPETLGELDEMVRQLAKAYG